MRTKLDISECITTSGMIPFLGRVLIPKGSILPGASISAMTGFIRHSFVENL